MKIKMLDEATIVLGNGVTLHISESIDGCYNLDINDTYEGGIRLGIEEEQGMHYMNWKDIKKKVVIEETVQV